jgi:hypothetical protein
VIFPRTWRQCQDIVQEGEIVRVKGKFDNSRGDPQIIAEDVSQNLTVQQVESNGHDPAPTNDAGPPWAEDELPPPDDFEPGVAPMEDFAPPEADFPGVEDAEVTLLQPADLEIPPPLVFDPVEVSSGPAQWILVYLQRSDDPERDQRRLQRVYNALVEFPGQDRFSIITESAGQAVKLDFQITTEICDDLLDNLRKIVGSENIQIHPQHS